MDLPLAREDIILVKWSGDEWESRSQIRGGLFYYPSDFILCGGRFKMRSARNLPTSICRLFGYFPPFFLKLNFLPPFQRIYTTGARNRFPNSVACLEEA